MVDVELEGTVARIFLNRPEKANALNSAMLLALADAVHSVEPSGPRVVVIAGRGRNFCGGADVAELKALVPATAGAFVEKIHQVCKAIRALPVPVVARLHGAVIGAGLEIAAACDLRVAADGTKFSMPEVKLGIPSVVEAALLPRLMGSGRAAWLVLTGEPIDARRALEWDSWKKSHLTRTLRRKGWSKPCWRRRRRPCGSRSGCCSSGTKRRSRLPSRRASPRSLGLQYLVRTGGSRY